MPKAENASHRHGPEGAKSARQGDKMSDQSQVQNQESGEFRLPQGDVQVDFGSPASGLSEPMPEERRAEYESRIRNSLDAQAAGAERASKLFIR
jgi:hypothetical protein